jgi:transcriptional regulator with XRE-family HTH domain
MRAAGSLKISQRRGPPPPAFAGLLRNLRRQRGLRLDDLGQRAGFTKGFLSKLETGKATPPIATLMRLASALGVEPSALLGSAGNGTKRVAHVASGARARVDNAGAGPGYEYWALSAPRAVKAMEPFLLTVKPGQLKRRKRFQHPGEEFIFVLEGRTRYHVGAETFTLERGDSLYFDAEVPHAPEPLGGAVTFLAIFCAPPRPGANTGVGRV